MEQVLKRFQVFLVTILLGFSLFACSDFSKPDAYKLIKVIDGDSILVRDPATTKVVEVRMLSIDAPEYKQAPWGPAAAGHLRGLLDEDLFLEFDIQEKDKYGRTLAYVFDANHELVNQKMLADGFATLFIAKNNTKYVLELKKALASAKSQALNIWDPEKGLKMSPYKFRQKNKSKKKRGKTSTRK